MVPRVRPGQTEDAEERILKAIEQESAAKAEDSAQRLMKEFASSPVPGVIDQRTVLWSIGRIFRQRFTELGCPR